MCKPALTYTHIQALPLHKTTTKLVTTKNTTTANSFYDPYFKTPNLIKKNHLLPPLSVWLYFWGWSMQFSTKQISSFKYQNYSQLSVISTTLSATSYKNNNHHNNKIITILNKWIQTRSQKRGHTWKSDGHNLINNKYRTRTLMHLFNSNFTKTPFQLPNKQHISADGNSKSPTQPHHFLAISWLQKEETVCINYARAPTQCQYPNKLNGGHRSHQFSKQLPFCKTCINNRRVWVIDWLVKI